MNPYIWGPSFWKFLIFIVHTYFNNVKNFNSLNGLTSYNINVLHKFFNSLGNVLPCKLITLQSSCNVDKNSCARSNVIDSCLLSVNVNVDIMN